VAAGVLFREKDPSRGGSRITLAVSSLPVSAASDRAFPSAEDLEAARDAWDAAQARARTERLVAAMRGPPVTDDLSAAPAAPDEA
jgi:hypothetical protein